MKILIIAGSLCLGLLMPCVAADSASKGRVLHHIVSFKFREGASPEQIKMVEDAFRELKTKIKEIKRFEWGTNVSPEKHDKGFTHCWILSFANEKDRDTYLNHAEHKAFGKKIGGTVSDVFVIDFWAKD
jgi:hypothetical protein